ncbi:gamma-glutamyltransferase [Thalassotalea euphylliae]|uniref:Glutathione hydrolase proenzyme n=1 Tax=Thalassotalea euphylliae TaxID=1655234 RepID=A0A3E0TYC2_9GAMM|nr:gamma-glutamyltransferase [Thalassotalea euphylliae]REL29363.1 gamma-glutamyltransferase [Thalassotalea euphylliae]
MKKHFLPLSLLSIALTCSFSSAAFSEVKVRETREPEAATGLTQKQVVVGSDYMVAAANPYASEAGYNILAKGGSAVDAAIAVQLVLTLVEPQSSGIGGGAFILHWDQANKQLTTVDGRETAPAKASSDMFLDKSGKPIKWIDAVVGGRSVGVPGVLSGLKAAHDKYGKLPWAALFDEAITLADQGFIVSPRLEKLVAMKFNPGIVKLPEIANYFFPNGEPIKAGQRLVNKPLAEVYRTIAREGVEAFYQGKIAHDIVNAVHNAEIAPGSLSLKDMKDYQPKWREAVCGDYHSYQVCGMAPPSSGGIAVIQILKQLEPFKLSKQAYDTAQPWHLFTQSSRLAFADRDKYVADQDFVTVPTQALLADTYLDQRAQLIQTEKDMGTAQAGQPVALSYAINDSFELPSTSHISIVDGDGNAISMTTSVEMAFGSAVMVHGFILNNQLTDFALSPERNGQPVANRVEPFKRPRSSMAPMMVFNPDGSLKLVVGSPGGSRIINYVAQTIVGVLDWQLNPQQAINLPKITNRNKVTTLEKGTAIAALKSEFEARGHKVMVRDLNSGVHAIEVKNGKLYGGADPRREGKVLAK